MTKNTEALEQSIAKLAALNPPQKILLHQLENLNVLKCDYLQAANYAESIIQLNSTNFNRYKKVLQYIFQAKEFKLYLEKLEAILEKHQEFKAFDADQVIDCLDAVYDGKEAFSYLLKLGTRYPQNWRVRAVFTQMINQLSPNDLKYILTPEDKKAISTLNLNGYTKMVLFDAPSETHDVPSSAQNLQEYKKIFYKFVEENAFEEAFAITEKMANAQEMRFFLQSIPQRKELKRTILEKKDTLNTQSVIISPISQDAKGTIIVFSGLAMQAMMPFEIIDRFFSAMNLNAIYLIDANKTAFLDGIEGCGNSIESAAQYLKTLVKTGDIYTLGSSAGGMAAAIYANELNAKKALCFSPPSSFAASFETRAKLFLRRMQKSFALEALDIHYYMPTNYSKTAIEIFHAENNPTDTMQAEGYRTITNITINTIENTDRHDILNVLGEKENLAEFFTRKLELA